MAESKKSRKAGRNRNYAAVYKGEGRKDINKAKRLYRYLRKGINTLQVITALKRITPHHLTRARKELTNSGFITGEAFN